MQKNPEYKTRTVRIKRRFDHHHHRINRHCRFGTGCVGGSSLCLVMVGCFVIFALLLLLLFFIIQPCSSDMDCAQENPCSVDFCRANRCVHEYKKDCCLVDDDCERTSCHSTFCDKIRNKCTAMQKQNGTQCTDHNRCTVNDKCYNGECQGNALNCNFNQCSNGQCYKDRGCVYTNKLDETPCDDGNSCTIGDKCWSGMCTSGILKDCSYLDSGCNVGMCDVTNGTCVVVPKANGQPCSLETNECQKDPVCKNGVCEAEEKVCFDNNPCTIDACVEGIGCTSIFNFTGGTCGATCVNDADCPVDYVCHDGTCLNMPIGDQIDVRFLDYELENCTKEGVSGHRLLLSFVMTANKNVILLDTYYNVIKEAADITTPTAQPLGFIDEVLNLDTTLLNADTTKSAFMVTTACQAVTGSNCDTIFAQRNYNLNLKLTQCMDISTKPYQNCIDPNIHVSANVAISISDCKNFAKEQILYVVGDGVLWHRDTEYVGMNSSNVIDLHPYLAEETRVYAGIKTNIYNNSNLRANLFSVRICSPLPDHHLSPCVTGQVHQENSFCPYVGCFGWENTFDNPLNHYLDLMQLGYLTAISKVGTYDTYGCYHDDIYFSSDSKKCDAKLCPTSWWPHEMDDGLSFLLEWVKTHPKYGKDPTLVVDMVYKITQCANNLRSGREELHQINTIKLKL